MEPSEDEDSSDEEPSLPLRCSFTITKVRRFLFHAMARFETFFIYLRTAAFCAWRDEHRRGMPRGYVRRRERVVL